MTDYAGYLLKSPASGATNAALSGDLGEFGADYWPPHSTIRAATVAGAIARNLPVETHPRAVVGSELNSYRGDYYDRIHILPALINFGTIASTQTSQVTIWNAFIGKSVTMGALEQSGTSGLFLSPVPVVGQIYEPLQSLTFELTASTEGPNSIDGLYTWDFGADGSATLTVQGQRLIPWTISPQWSDTLVETLEWRTDVMLMKSGVEQRRVIRTTPRRTWEFSFLCQQNYRRWAEASLFQWGQRTWLLPVWTDTVRLTTALDAGSSSVGVDATNLDFEEGGLLLLLSDPLTFEVMTINLIEAGTITFVKPTINAWPIGAKVVPLRKAILNQEPQVERITSDAIQGRMQFLSMESETFTATDPADLPQYRGYPVLEDRHEYTDNPKFNFPRNVQKLDYDVGLIETFDISGMAFETQTMGWLSGDKSERTRLKSLFYMLRGRDGTIWVPTGADDLEVVQLIAGNSAQITIANMGYTNLLVNQIGKQDIRIELRDGTVYYRRINTSTVEDDQEVLVVDSVLPQPIQPEDILQVSFMVLSRLDGDAVEFDYETDSTFRVVTTFRGVGDVV